MRKRVDDFWIVGCCFEPLCGQPDGRKKDPAAIDTVGRWSASRSSETHGEYLASKFAGERHLRTSTLDNEILTQMQAFT